MTSITANSILVHNKGLKWLSNKSNYKVPMVMKLLKDNLLQSLEESEHLKVY